VGLGVNHNTVLPDEGILEFRRGRGITGPAALRRHCHAQRSRPSRPTAGRLAIVPQGILIWHAVRRGRAIGCEIMDKKQAAH
jgi:hypothetical protein